MRKKFYVYFLTDDEGHVFYVGKGSGNRVDQHVYIAKTNYSDSKTRNQKLYNKIRKLIADGKSVKSAIVFSSLNEQECLDKEAEIIEQIGLTNLCNLVAGGGGYAKKVSNELSHNTRVRMSVAKKGKRFTEEHRKRISISLKGRKLSESHLTNMAKSKVGIPLSQSHKENISKSLNGGVPFMSYSEAKQWLKNNRPDIRTKQRFIDFRSDNKFPTAMPKDVYGRYTKSGSWVSWPDFLSQ